MYQIKKVALDDADRLPIDRPQWGYTTYQKEVYAQIVREENGFAVRFTVREKNPRRLWKDHFSPVHEDSCVEFFANFSPDTTDWYINFEVNANGAMNLHFRRDRYETKEISKEEVDAFRIEAEVDRYFWRVTYHIGDDFIRKYYPDYDPEKADKMKCNLYKCGDRTLIPHYMAAFDLECTRPDFHRPEYFQYFEICRD